MSNANILRHEKENPPDGLPMKCVVASGLKSCMSLQQGEW